MSIGSVTQNNATLYTLRATSLVDLVPGLKRSGQYWIGPCPFCGGKDRFNVKQTDSGDLWLCRHCSPDKYHDAIDFLQRQTGKTFKELVNDGASFNARAAAPLPAATAAPAAIELAQPPTDDWQIPAIVAAGDCANYLRSGASDAAKVYDYLRNDRKLTPATLDAATVGYNPRWRDVGDGCRLAPGVTIPCMVDGELWYLQVRTTQAARRQAERSGKRLGKYHALTGSRLGALYGADALLSSTVAIVTEGEFDAMVVNQYCRPGVAAVTMGSAGTLPGVTWLRYFAHLKRIVLLLDNDDAGRAALDRWQRLLPRAVAVQLPDGSKDATDFRRNGGYLAGWVKDVTT